MLAHADEIRSDITPLLDTHGSIKKLELLVRVYFHTTEGVESYLATTRHYKDQVQWEVFPDEEEREAHGNDLYYVLHLTAYESSNYVYSSVLIDLVGKELTAMTAQSWNERDLEYSVAKRGIGCEEVEFVRQTNLQMRLEHTPPLSIGQHILDQLLPVESTK
ncbi:MAG: hypothetical protein ABIR91_01550 [Candidatus Saccharimonadales bacterium]